jgi:hypothetical protein
VQVQPAGVVVHQEAQVPGLSARHESEGGGPMMISGRQQKA